MYLASQAPVVQIDGLHIGVTGEVELVFDYDSDWSDLADDEEPDSNDERFDGNDYPEDREDDDDEDDSEVDDDERYGEWGGRGEREWGWSHVAA